MKALLDVNVLIALFDPMHVHHEAAHEWFAGHRHAGWATCPLTENGFVRVVSNPRYRPGYQPGDIWKSSAMQIESPTFNLHATP